MAEATNNQASGAATQGTAPGGSSSGAPGAGAAPTAAAPGDRPVKIVGIVCNWCSYAGADTAGVGRFKQPANLRLVRVPCTGRIDPLFALKAFEKGADGVLVSGCHFGDCHYVFGNERAVEQFEKTKSVVKMLGLEDGRLRLEWISAAEGARFAHVIDEFIGQLRELVPSPLAGDGPPVDAAAHSKAEEVTARV